MHPLSQLPAPPYGIHYVKEFDALMHFLSCISKCSFLNGFNPKVKARLV